MLCGFLATPLSGRPPQEFLIAGILLAVGAILWVVNRLFVGRVEVDADQAGQVLSCRIRVRNRSHGLNGRPRPARALAWSENHA